MSDFGLEKHFFFIWSKCFLFIEHKLMPFEAMPHIKHLFTFCIFHQQPTKPDQLF